MKKLYTLLIAMTVTGSIFAQDHGRNHGQENQYGKDKAWAYQQKDNHFQTQPYYNSNDRYYGKPAYNNERDRRIAIDQINRDCDQQINVYRNDRSINRYERDRRIAVVERSRQTRLSSFGKSLLAGAIGGIIAGAIFSH